MVVRHCTIRAVAYYRVSTDRQDASIQQQRDWAHRACLEHGIEIVAEFEDVGIPGDEIRRRRGLQDLFAFCEQQQEAGRPIAAIVAWDQDRFSRADSIKTAVCVDRLMEAGVGRMFTNDGWIDWADDTDRVLSNIKQDFGKRGYSKSLSKNVSRSCLERARKGQWSGGRRPYGYALGEDRHLILGDPAEVEAVRWMFHTYATRRVSLRWMAKQLQARGTTPPRYRRAKDLDGKPLVPSSGRWRRDTLTSILTNPIYTGDLFYGRTHGGKYHRVAGGRVVACQAVKTASGGIKVIRSDVEEQTVAPNAHPALVDRETFRLVQRRLRENRPAFKPGSSSRSGACRRLFGGLLYCGDCGCLMHGTAGKVKCGGRSYEWPGYSCSVYLRQGRAVCYCNAIRETDLLPLVARALRDHLKKPELLARVQKDIMREAKARRMENVGRVGPLRKRLAELEQGIRQGTARLASIPEDLVDGLVKQLREWKAEQDSVAAELKAMEWAEVSAKLGDEKIKRTLERLDGLEDVLRNEDVTLAREVLRDLVERIDLHFTHEDRPHRSRSKFSHGLIRTTPLAKFFGLVDIGFPILPGAA